MQEKLSKRNKKQEKLSKVNIGLRFKAVRFEKGISQLGMAALLSLSRSNYSQIELGKQYPTFETLVTFAKYFNKNYEWILHGEQTAEPWDLTSSNDIEKGDSAIVPFPVSISHNGKTVKVATDEYISYIKNSADSSYIDNLPSFDILGQSITNTTSLHRTFEVAEKNHSLSLAAGDFIIAKPVFDSGEMIFGSIYVTVSDKEIKIIEILDFIEDSVLVCKSKHPDDRFLQLSSLREIWIATGIYSARSTPFLDDLVVQVAKLDVVLKNMKNEMDKLKKVLDI